MTWWQWLAVGWLAGVFVMLMFNAGAHWGEQECSND